MNPLISELQSLLRGERTPGLIKIQASAGSGKTYALTLCYLIILNELSPSPEDLSSILAITFTNNAAQEMKERILTKLKSIALLPKHKDEDAKVISKALNFPPEKAAAWIEVIIKNYNYLMVSTIDSFLYNILRGISLEHGTNPDLKVETNLNWLLETAFEELVIKAKSDQRIMEVFLNCVETFLRIQGKNGFFVEQEIKNMFQNMFQNFRLEVASQGDISPYFKDLGTVRRLFLNLCKRLEDALSENDIKLVRNNLDYLRDPLNHLNKSLFWKDSILELVPKKLRNKVSPELETLYSSMKKSHIEYLYQEAIHKVKSYTEFFHHMMEELNNIKERMGIIPMGTWVDIALKHLSKDSLPGIYAILGSKIHYVLMDEFQDTSLSQWQALMPLVENTLSEGGKFVYVGDPKQSIYLWRNADPRIFCSVKDWLNFEEACLSLNYNYRSTPEIIDFNNKLYSKLTNEAGIGVVEDMLLGKNATKENESTQEVFYLRNLITKFYGDATQEYPSYLKSSQDGIQKRASEIEIRPLDSKEEVFSHIVEIIDSLVQKGVSLNEIAVLSRHNNKIEEISQYLWEKGYPCITRNSLNLLNNPLVVGLVNMLRFLKYPRDILSLTRLLTSGIFDEISEQELYSHFLTGEDRPEDIIRKKYPTIMVKIKELLELKHLLTPYLLVAYVVNKERLLERYPQDSLFLVRFLDIMLSLESQGVISIEDLLERLEIEEKRIGVIEGIDAVRILTIHECKGLEFPVVILAFANWSPRSEKIVLLKEGLLAYVRSPYPGQVAEAVYENKAKETLEALNLLYVATTRAKERLYVILQKVRGASVGDLFG